MQLWPIRGQGVCEEREGTTLAEQIELDLTVHIPIYRQLVDQIRSRIEAGELVAGEQLPTVRQLADQLEVNFNTVARAYRLLDELGWISTQHGRGTFVLSAEQRKRALGSGGRKPGSRDGERDRSSLPTLRQLARRFARRAQRFGFSPEQVAREVGFVLEEWAQEDE